MTATRESEVRVGLVYPELLGTYGDGGPDMNPLDPDGVFHASDAAGQYPGDYCDNEAGGYGFLRLDTPCWTNTHPEIQVTVVNGKKDEKEKSKPPKPTKPPKANNP